MVDVNKLIPLARLGVFSGVCLLSVIVFALSCHVLNSAGGWAFAGLSLATAILTLISLPPLYWISVNRKGAFVSYIVVEVAWLWFLWIMWIASAGTTASLWIIGHGGLASEIRVIEAFGFINWLAVMFYTVALFVLSLISAIKGTSSVWTSAVLDFDFNAAINKTSAAVQQPVPMTQDFAPQMQMQPQPQPQTFMGQPASQVPQAAQV